MAASAAILFVIIGKGHIMATAPQSGQPIQLGSGNQLQAIAQLLPALLGSKQTQSGNPGDVSSLQALIGELQGADYSKTLEAIFQQAGGQIPGLQAAFSNAVGARSGSNSAVQAALSKLLQDTTLAGQKQVADQQLQNQSIRANAGGSIASATKNTTQTQKTSGSLPQLTALLGLVQAAKMATGSRDIEEMGRKLGLGGSPGRDAGVAPVSGPSGGAPVAGAAPITGAAAPQMSTAPGGFDISAVLGGGPAGGDGIVTDSQPFDFGFAGYDEIGGMNMAPSFNFNEVLGGGGMSTPGIPAGGGFNMDYFNQPEYDFGFGGGVDEFNF